MKRPPHSVLLVFFFILLIRLAPVFFSYLQGGRQLLMSGDADPVLYLGGARAMLETGTNPFSFFPPLNFMFIAACLYWGGGHVLVAMGAVAIVGWLTVIGLYLLARELFEEKTALLPAVLAGCYPAFVFYGATFYSETLALFFIVLSFLMVARSFHKSRYSCLLIGGMLWGLASLTRGGIHIFSVVVVMVMIINQLRAGIKVQWKPAAAFLLATYLTILTVGIMVSPLQGEFSLNAKSGIGSFVHGANRITTSCADYGDVRGTIFYHINSCGEQWPKGSQLYSDHIWELSTGEILVKTFRFIAQDPLTYVRNSLKKLSCLWSPNQAPIYYIKMRFPWMGSLFKNIMCGGIYLFTFLIIAGGVCGLALARDSFRPLFILFLLFYCMMVFFTVGNSKLRLPLMPFFIVYCAHFISRVVLGTASWKKVQGRLLVLLTLVLLIGNSVYKYREVALSPGEFRVRQVELLSELGFPETALSLLEKYAHFSFYTKSQRNRMSAVERNARSQVQPDNGDRE